MRRIIFPLFIFVVICFAFAGSSFAQIGPTFRANRSIGTELTDQSGRPVGKIEDFVIDPSIGRVIEVMVQQPSQSTHAFPFNVVMESHFGDRLVYNPSEASSRYYGQAPYWSENPYLSHPYSEGSYEARGLIGATVRASDGEMSRIRDLEFSSLDGSVYAVFPFRVQGTVKTVKVPLSYMQRAGERTFELDFINTSGRHIGRGYTKGMDPYRWGGEAQDF